jgi:UDP-N-acetylglucosamine:LPS N-acetylglucosamine transferase
MSVKVLAVLGDGGHTTEMARLLCLLGPDYRYSYMLTTTDRISESKIAHPGPIYRVLEPLGKHTGERNPLRVLWATLQQIGVLWRVRPRVIVTSGANVAVPICVLGRLAGVKIIFIETGSRVFSLSSTGKLMYRIAHLFFVQWEPLTERYPRAIYAGRLL